MPRRDEALRAIDALLEEWDSAWSNRGRSLANVTTLTARLSAAIRRYSPRVNSPYVAEAERFASHYSEARAQAHAEVLRALRADIAAGYLATVEELVHAGIFGDFLEMAAELLNKGFKDPAAVMTGSVLEEHLRKLCEAAGIPSESTEGRPIKADALNASLSKANVYNKLEQKSITAWLDLRNKAAHGKYDEYQPQQVETLISEVRAFLVRHPA